MIAVIFKPEKQAAAVDRLVKYCALLDGTKVEVLSWGPDPADAKYPDVCNQAFQWTAQQVSRPFFWLEADSIPLRPGWLRALEVEYLKGGKPIMISSDQQTPFDLSCGIGIYDPFLIREDFPTDFAGGWDGWLVEHAPHLPHRTELIQHSYGKYNTEGVATGWEFPRDSWLLRKSAQIFHKDQSQSLIPKCLQ